MRPDKAAARAAGVPSWLRQYSRRYGRGVYDLLQSHDKYTKQGVLTLDHGRDRQLAKMGIPALPKRIVIEGVALAS
jgi:hypothetical protein